MLSSRSYILEMQMNRFMFGLRVDWERSARLTSSSTCSQSALLNLKTPRICSYFHHDFSNAWRIISWLFVLELEGNIFCQHFPFGTVRLHYYHNISYYRNMYSQSHAVYLNALIYHERGTALRCQWFQHKSLSDNVMWRFRLWMPPILQSVFKNGDLLYANTCFYFYRRRHRFTSYASIPPTPVIAAAIFGSSSPCSWMQ